jgi:hypothetical protein
VEQGSGQEAGEDPWRGERQRAPERSLAEEGDWEGKSP